MRCHKAAWPHVEQTWVQSLIASLTGLSLGPEHRPSELGPLLGVAAMTEDRTDGDFFGPLSHTQQSLS
jgi:hypothetical protein